MYRVSHFVLPFAVQLRGGMMWVNIAKTLTVRNCILLEKVAVSALFKNWSQDITTRNALTFAKILQISFVTKLDISQPHFTVTN